MSKGKRKSEIAESAEDKHALRQTIEAKRKEGEPSLHCMLFTCGCERTYDQDKDIPLVDDKCEHGNFFIKYSETANMTPVLLSSSKEELITKIINQHKILEDLRPIVEIGDHENLSWLGLPPILQDLGFSVKEQSANGDVAPIDIYFRDGVACYKNLEGLWVVTKGDYKMAFKLDTKFHAYQLFTILGIKFKNEDSTASGVGNEKISDILKNIEDEEE